MVTPAILYLDTIPGERIQKMTLAGIRRYAAVRGWDVVAVPREKSRPAAIPALLAAHKPVAGCVVECSDGRRDLPPRLFGKTPVVYLHTAPSFYGGRGMRVNSDNAAIAAAAFNELSAGRPEAFAAVAFAGFSGKREWSLAREEAFAALAAKSGKPFFHLAWKKETKARRAARLAAWISSLPHHTAIFAVNDATAAEIAAVARAARRSIPRELTLLGVDNLAAVCESSGPAISSIQIDHELAGYKAARMIGEGRAMRDSLSATIGPLLTVRRASTGGSGCHERFILDAVQMIRREAFDPDFTAAGLAARFRCSYRLFRLRFREATGHSIADEIQHVRLEKVFTLLAQTDTAIGAVAGLCGYRSNIALKWIFRKVAGMSMREWRGRNRL